MIFLLIPSKQALLLSLVCFVTVSLFFESRTIDSFVTAKTGNVLSLQQSKSFIIQSTVTGAVAVGGPKVGQQQQWQTSALAASATTAAASLPLSNDDSSSSSGTTTKSGGGTATIPSHVFNLVKGIVGAGVLSLPSGIAAYGDAPSAVIPAVFLIAIIGALSGYGFALIGRVCAITGTTSYRDAWKESVSEQTSWIPAVSVTFKTICAVLAYSMILGDTFHSLLTSAQLLPTTFSPKLTLIGLTSGILLPLCLLKNLSSLAPFSLLGTLGMVYTTIAMAIRYFGKAYVPGVGQFVADLPLNLQPAFGTKGAISALNPTTAILLGMLSTAYMAHFNAPKFYTELQNNTIPRYLKVVSISFGISILMFAAITALGYLTFGGNCSGLILNNYSGRDTLMSLSRIAVAISLVFSYPLAFTGARDGILNLLNISKIKQQSTLFMNTLTISLLSVITCLAMIIPDVSFVLAFAGATLGNALIYIFPGFMFHGAIKKLKSPTKLQQREVKIAITSAILGTGLGIMGAIKAVQSIM